MSIRITTDSANPPSFLDDTVSCEFPFTSEGGLAESEQTVLDHAPTEPDGTPAASAMPAVGDVLEGRWRLDAVIGRGGMGTVYRGHDLVRGEDVAVKVLDFEACTGLDARRRFERETQITMNLRSPNIVRVLGSSVLPSGSPFMVMELLEGSTLKAIGNDRGALSVAEVVSWLLRISEAVAEAHAAGVVHRDLKLENVFLANTPMGATIKVLDFGLAKRCNDSSPLTSASKIMGTPRYMPPEQFVRTRDVDERGDVWAIGVCAYRLLTRRYPFDAQSLGALCAQLASGRPPVDPCTVNPQIPREIGDVVLRCLEGEPDARYSDALELTAALRLAQRSAAPARSRRFAPTSVTRLYTSEVRVA